MTEDEPFRAWARSVTDGAAAALLEAIPGAVLGKRRSLVSGGFVSVYVHFTDTKLPQTLALWLYSSLAGGPNNFKGHPDILPVGLKQDADEEFDRDVLALPFARIALRLARAARRAPRGVAADRARGSGSGSAGRGDRGVASRDRRGAAPARGRAPGAGLSASR